MGEHDGAARPSCSRVARRQERRVSLGWQGPGRLWEGRRVVAAVVGECSVKQRERRSRVSRLRMRQS